MKKIKNYINEKQNFLIKNKNVLKNYDYIEYYPKTQKELKNIIIELLKQGINDLNCIDVSKITDMDSLFDDINKVITVKDIDISEWDVSNVTNMYNMFSGCIKFNSDLSKWDVSKVKNMNWTFRNCFKFNSDLSKWDVSNVEDIYGMFDGCSEFNSDLSKWDVSKVIDKEKEYAFWACTTLKKNNLIPDWYKGKV